MSVSKPPRIDWAVVESETNRPELVLELDFNDRAIGKDVGVRVEVDCAQVSLQFCRLDRRVQRRLAEEIFELAERRVRERQRHPGGRSRLTLATESDSVNRGSARRGHA